MGAHYTTITTSLKRRSGCTPISRAGMLYHNHYFAQAPLGLHAHFMGVHVIP